MKVCLVRPPSIIGRYSYIGSTPPHIGIAYLAGSLRAAGHDVTVIDAVGEDPTRSIAIDEHLVFRGLSSGEIVERIPRDSGLIGISGQFSSEWPFTRGLVNEIGEKFPSAVFVGGGEHFTAAAELCLDACPSMDLVARGEGEEILVDLANAIEAGRPFDSVSGLVLRDGSSFRSTEPRRRIRAIDEIPEPAWDLIPLQNYLDHELSYGVNRGRSIPMLASRGCPYQCTFCSNPNMWGTRWIPRNPQKVVDEIVTYKERYDIENVDFFDLTAIVKKRWIMEFCEELLERKVNITWQLPSGTRSEAIDREAAKMLYRSGCRNMNFAPESGSEATLVRIKKRVKLDRMTDSVRGATSENLNIKINIILGLPDDSHLDTWKTLFYLVKLSWHGAHDVSVGAFAPYPGSELYERLVGEGRIDHSDDFFKKLAYVDISDTESYCDNISSTTLRFYVWLAFAVFYLSNYAFRPIRPFRTLRNLLRGTHESRGEMALAQLVNRLRTVKQQ